MVFVVLPAILIGNGLSSRERIGGQCVMCAADRSNTLTGAYLSRGDSQVDTRHEYQPQPLVVVERADIGITAIRTNNVRTHSHESAAKHAAQNWGTINRWQQEQEQQAEQPAQVYVKLGRGQ
jgi:hypothetical protein